MMSSDDMALSKCLEFPVVALAEVGGMPAKGEDEQEAGRVFFCGCNSGYPAGTDWGAAHLTAISMTFNCKSRAYCRYFFNQLNEL